MKKAIGERVEVENQSFPTIEDLQQFVATRGNDIVITQLRPMKVVAPDSDLENLFKELVGERERSSHDGERSHIPELDREMQSDRIRQKLKLNLRIQLPIFERPILIPYAFRNGKLNLIKPQRFSSEKTALSIASALAVDGSLLARYPADGLSRELIVVSSFDDASRPLRPKVGELLDSFRVRHVPIENIGSLIREIEQQGHDE
jgi:hypothetical protein